jgi:hypothetical protein
MFKCCFVRNFLPLPKDNLLEGASDDKVGFFRAELRMLEDRKTGKHKTADMGDIGCLKGKVHRGAVLVSIDAMSMLGLTQDEIMQEVQHARTDNETHTLRFTHAPIHWLLPVKKHEEFTEPWLTSSTELQLTFSQVTEPSSPPPPLDSFTSTPPSTHMSTQATSVTTNPLSSRITSTTSSTRKRQF